MIQTFTLDDVVRYAYQEMSTSEAERFEEALVLDNELMDMFQQFDTVKKMVDTTSVLKDPPARTTNRILAYSHAYDMAAATE